MTQKSIFINKVNRSTTSTKCRFLHTSLPRFITCNKKALHYIIMYLEPLHIFYHIYDIYTSVINSNMQHRHICKTASTKN